MKASAKNDLQQIQKTSGEFREAQRLLRDIEKKQNLLKHNRRVIAEAAQQLVREEFIKLAEHEYLSKGLDVSLSLAGKDKTTLRFKYILVSRPFVYNFLQEQKTVSRLKELGFKKIVFTDGYFKSWNIDLDKL